MVLKYFGDIAVLEQDDTIRKEILLDGKDVMLSLMTSEVNSNISFILDNIVRFEELINHMVKQYKYNQNCIIGRKIHAYTKHHAIDLSAEDLADLIENDYERLPIEAKLIDVLYLFSVDFTPKSINWNFTLGEHLTNYLLEIRTNYTMNIKEVRTQLLSL